MAGVGRLARRAVLRGGAVALFPRLSLARPALIPGPAFRILAGPDGRDIPVTEWRPTGRTRGTILFSHGAGSAPRYYPDLIAGWVRAGHRVLAPIHVDSREHPHGKDYPGLASWKARIEDMRALIADIGAAPFVAAGHSYGGLVALTLGGAEPVPPPGMALPLFQRLARAVIAFSPPAPVPVLVTAGGYGALKVPALVQTGTADLLPGMTDPEGWRGHLVPYAAAAPGGHRYGLVLTGVNHYFGGMICDYTQPGPPQHEALAAATRVSELFLAAWGDGDGKAQRRLDGIVGKNPLMDLTKK
jgi:pimeloyl-ACP methyl ester carboxylesterase